MRLYEFTNAGSQLYELLQNSEIDEKTFHDTLEGMGANEKIEACCQVITQLTGEQAMFKLEKERCAEKESKAKKDIERIKKSMLSFLEATGQKSVNAGTFRVVLSYRDKVVVNDESKIPESFFKPQPAKLSLSDIKDAIKCGNPVPGAELIKNGSVTIK